MSEVADRKRRLAVPSEVRRLGACVRLHWQVDPGQLVLPHDPIARLDGEGDASLLLEVPSHCRGRVAELWVDDGATVMVGEPIMTLTVGEHEPLGLAEPPTQFVHPLGGESGGLGQADGANVSPLEVADAVPARRLSQTDRITLATVGGLGLAGLAFAMVGLLLGLIIRDGGPALLAAGSLAVVAAGLAYGKVRLDRIGA